MRKLRIWKLGSLEYQTVPTQAAFDKLAQMLKQAREIDDALVDILWGPDLQVIELPLDGEGSILNSEDLLVSAQELRDALAYIRTKKQENKNESNTTL